jgi:hypothetical protein
MSATTTSTRSRSEDLKPLTDNLNIDPELLAQLETLLRQKNTLAAVPEPGTLRIAAGRGRFVRRHIAATAVQRLTG